MLSSASRPSQNAVNELLEKIFTRRFVTYVRCRRTMKELEALLDKGIPLQIHSNKSWSGLQALIKATPKSKLHPAILDYLTRQKLWNVASDHQNLREQMNMVAPLQNRPGGSPQEAISFVCQTLDAFAQQNFSHRDLLNNIKQVLSEAADDSKSFSSWVAPGYIDTIDTGFIKHALFVLFIKIDDKNFKVIFSDGGLFYSNGASLKQLDVPAHKLQTVLQLLKDAKQSDQSTATEKLMTQLPKLTGSQYQPVSIITRGPFHYGRCYIENIYPIILLLMSFSLGKKGAELLFKKFKLFMWQSTLEEYKQQFKDRMTVEDNELVRLCEAAIVKKRDVIAALEKDMSHTGDSDHPVLILRKEMPNKYPKETLMDHAKDAYRKTFYNTDESTKERLKSFLGLPSRIKYDVTTKKLVTESDVALVLEYAAYCLLGWIIAPLKNILKLLVEFLPYCVQKAATIGIKDLSLQTDAKANPSTLDNVLLGGLLNLLHIIQISAKCFRVFCRLITSPVTSAKLGWQTHPVLGILSAVFSALLLSVPLILTTPLSLIPFITSLIPEMILAPVTSFIAHTTVAIKIILPSLIAVNCVTIICDILGPVAAFIENHIRRWHAAKEGKPPPDVRTTIQDLDSVRNTLSIHQALTSVAAKPIATPRNAADCLTKKTKIVSSTNTHDDYLPTQPHPALEDNRAEAEYHVSVRL